MARIAAMSLAESVVLRARSEAVTTLGALKDISELKYIIERETLQLVRKIVGE
jgi:hypothetical protein